MLSHQKNEFFLPEGITYLNHAYMAPSHRAVEEAGRIGLEKKRHPFHLKTEDFFEPVHTLRQQFSKLIQAEDHRRVVTIPSVSYGMANVARNLKLTRGEKIILAGEQFPSNVYPWKRLCEEKEARLEFISPPKATEGRGQRWNQLILNAIDHQTRMVALGNIHWVDGTLFDLQAIRQRTREVDALLVIDGTQSVGAYPLRVSEVEPDALICAGYKWLLGPYAIGLAYYGEYFDHGSPIEESWMNRWGSDRFDALVRYQDKYQEAGLRYGVGESSNFILVPMMGAALAQINTWGVEQIQNYCQALNEAPIQQLRAMGCWIEESNRRVSHLFGVRLPEHVAIENVQQALTKHQIYVSARGDAIRISTYLYNTAQDWDKLFECLEEAGLKQS